MSITYLGAQDEVFGVMNAAWLAAVEAADLSYMPIISFPGALVVTPDPATIYAECHFSVVAEKQVGLSQQGGVKLYQSTALLIAQVYAPKTDASALRTIQTIGSALRDAFRQLSPSGEVWFSNQRFTPVSGNDTRHQVNTVVTCVYKTLQ